MRRPVKPFVTEYKGPNRRPSHSGGSTSRPQGEEFSYAQAANETLPRASGDVAPRLSEDAYGAAMRAADALFSPAADKTSAPVDPSRPGHRPAHGRRGPSGAEAAEQSAPGGGRVLRVIDEPPASGFADLEAERQPKRRGRKPGSKNKPKSGIFATPSAPRTGFAASQFVEDAAVDTAAAAALPAPRSPRIGARSRDAKRFAWVRTKLKPGEEWKRRLPKVCW